MNLFVRTVTLLEANGEPSPFPKRLRQLLCSVVEGIDAEAMPDLLSKRETDRDNFDGKIEAGLRELDPLLAITANCPISDRTKFNNDLVIDADEALVCVEIEKGYLSRFEFDILKMQAFACSRQLQHPGKPVFGAFVVPDDNVVARHISGNSGESSFRYLTRLCHLVVQVRPLHVEDILIVGYSRTHQVDDDHPQEKRDPAKPPKGRGLLMGQDSGLLTEDQVASGLRGDAGTLVAALRSRLAAACPKLREKLNPNSRYLAYGLAGGKDALYVYVQKKGVLIDMRVSADRADELRRQGFDLRPRNNYQAKAGWLTGLFVPHDTSRIDEVVLLAVEALQEEQAEG